MVFKLRFSQLSGRLPDHANCKGCPAIHSKSIYPKYHAVPKTAGPIYKKLVFCLIAIVKDMVVVWRRYIVETGLTTSSHQRSNKNACVRAEFAAGI